ncbi:MAG: 2-oxoacid:acceptor oxidoreductase family protein [Anaerolineales bacterium]
MSQTEIVISGFGGQGALLAGQILAEAGMHEGKHVTWLPSYGPEMRGGTANCTVIIGDEPIGSPIIQRPAVVIALNKPSVTKYAPMLKSDGYLIINASQVDEAPGRSDIHSLMIEASGIAERLGSVKMANIVALGALLSVVPVVDPTGLKETLKRKVKKIAPDLVEANMRALDEGLASAHSYEAEPGAAMPQGG